jgi:hypothetical protein
LQKTAIYTIIKKVKAAESTATWPSQSKKTIRTPDIIASVAAAIEEDCHLSKQSLLLMGYLKKPSSTFSSGPGRSKDSAQAAE